MKTQGTVGIIAEYNPFHNGHLYQLENARRLTGSQWVVVVMSGQFVQRGEPALLDKFCRTRMALLAGADLVLELPFLAATSNGQTFARGAVSVLNGTGITDSLCFGSEWGDINKISEAASKLANESDDIKLRLKQRLAAGDSYPKARFGAYANDTDTSAEALAALAQPNNMLAIEYLSALAIAGSDIKPYTIKRIGQYHSAELNCPLASATAIRHAVGAGLNDAVKHHMPRSCYELMSHKIKSGETANFDSLFHAFKFVLATRSELELSEIAGMGEGLYNRIIKAASQSGSMTDVIRTAKTKRYTYARISRGVLHMILGVTQAEADDFAKIGPRYIRVLGFRRDSQGILSALIENARLPVITNLKQSTRTLDAETLTCLRREIAVSDIYNLALTKSSKTGIQKEAEYSEPLVIV